MQEQTCVFSILGAACLLTECVPVKGLGGLQRLGEEEFY